MYITYDAYEKIVKKYPTLLISEDDPHDAFEFVHTVLCAEADALREKDVPFATHTIDALLAAAYRVWDVMNDIDTDNIEEED